MISRSWFGAGAFYFVLLAAFPVLADDPPAKAEKPGKPIAVHYERYGGFAGFQDDIRIFTDYTFELATPPAVPHVFRGKLSKKHQDELAAHLQRYGKFVWEESDGPRVADGMKQRIDLRGKGAVREENPKQLKTLLSHILVEARKAEKVPKER